MATELKALERVRPGATRTPPILAAAPWKPGEVIVIAFAAAVGAEVILRASPSWPLEEQFFSMKTSAACNVVFGPTGAVSAPGATSALLEPGDSWQDFQFNADDGAIRIFSATTGNLYLILSGR